MSPPTDTAIPVGDIVLENTLIKEIGLKISGNIDDFDAPIENVKMSFDILQEELKNLIILIAENKILPFYFIQI